MATLSQLFLAIGYLVSIENLFKNNKKWADQIKQEQPNFFSQLSKQQNPEYLWIGCSDSRVPANELLGMAPGEVFVHRNIANQVIHTDLNCLSVLHFAVEILKVKHVIICGHYGCGGITAAYNSKSYGVIDHWLRHIKDVYRFNQQQLDNILDEKERINRYCEINVIEQVGNICNSNALREAWQKNQEVSVHGFIYNLHDGILKDLHVSVSGFDK
jgi:carbonic anhydrase